MGNQILRNGLIIVGTLIAAVVMLRITGIFGHTVANTASRIEGKV